jgi:toxin secretion/phage lysis holin
MVRSILLKLFISLTALFAPVMPLLLTVGVMIAFDTFVGIVRSLKLKKKIQSKLFWTGLLQKIAITAGSVCCVYFMDKYIIQSGLHLERVVATIICLTEAKSISESLEMLYGYNIWDYLKKIIMKGNNTAKEILEEDTKNKNKPE